MPQFVLYMGPIAFVEVLSTLTIESFVDAYMCNSRGLFHVSHEHIDQKSNQRLIGNYIAE